jgi:hypothetical protein
MIEKYLYLIIFPCPNNYLYLLIINIKITKHKTYVFEICRKNC